jgi:single-strand DNA-binding protein
VATFRLAITPRVRKGDTWTDGETSFLSGQLLVAARGERHRDPGNGARAVVIGRLRMRSSETEEGERRSVVEVEADEVGPSLKFATATLERTSAKGAAGGQSQ